MRITQVSLLLAAWIVSCLGVFAQGTAKGLVYEDLNRNGNKDRTEKGLANVAVSNGLEVVLTNAKGEYSLPISDDNIIFVIKPASYTVPVNELQQPQFFHIHKPTFYTQALQIKVISTTKFDNNTKACRNFSSGLKRKWTRRSACMSVWKPPVFITKTVLTF